MHSTSFLNLIQASLLALLVTACTTTSGKGAADGPAEASSDDGADVKSGTASPLFAKKSSADFEAMGFQPLAKKAARAPENETSSISDDKQNNQQNDQQDAETDANGSDQGPDTKSKDVLERAETSDDSDAAPAAPSASPAHPAHHGKAAAQGTRATVKENPDLNGLLGGGARAVSMGSSLSAPKVLTDIECQKAVAEFSASIRRLGSRVITKRLKIGFLIVSDDSDDERFLFLAPIGVLNPPSGTLQDTYFRCLDDGSYYDALSVTTR